MSTTNKFSISRKLQEAEFMKSAKTELEDKAERFEGQDT